MAKVEQGVEQQSLPLLDHLARVGRRAAETSMSPGGLRPRHLIALKLLSEHGAASQQGLAEALSLDPSNVVGLLNELEERGLITRRRDPADRRRHIVELSAGGRAGPEGAGAAVPAARRGGRRRRREGGGLPGGRPPWLRRLAGARPACCRGTPRPPWIGRAHV